MFPARATGSFRPYTLPGRENGKGNFIILHPGLIQPAIVTAYISQGEAATMKSNNNKVVMRTLSNYSVIDRETGTETKIKNVWFTFYHDGVIDLYTSETIYQSFNRGAVDVFKRGL